ncbi:3,4-dihydroxyphenylacetate 2,3-dioxygenase [Nocardia panacis]|uniref:3,4-dihydroxyphenylacetate 2,3-dioxygenase n=1 Tax=Nocardia panacis TaxID=2340916 RepID=A0A3A4KBH8_9NOCA|nr:3,4-dihydroxyphenylacetate 2,3-dioxygenase [Nocardia panacis]RJO79217.1 3,4-dihydroxyphenylacetate 2,3-dioxygenase [Nocardia panacis]
MPTPPDILRAASAELVVTDLERSRWFYTETLGLVVTAADDDALYLRGMEEYTHHSLVLRRGEQPALARLSYRVRTPADLDAAEAYFGALGLPTRRVPAGTTLGIGEAVRVLDPLGFPMELFHDVTHVPRLTQRYDLYHGVEPARLDHFNVMTPDIAAGHRFYSDLGFRCSETIEDESTLYAAWLARKSTVHDIALTGGAGPRLHHIAFFTPEARNVLHLCDVLGSLGNQAHIERGPGRHGVSNAFYVYLRDPDGHRVEIYTTDYYTGDPDNPTLRWDVRDERRRDFWGHAVVESWYREASTVLDLDGRPQQLLERAEPHEIDVVVGADGFTAARESLRQ